MPLIELRKLHLPWRKKIGVAAIFGTGTLLADIATVFLVECFPKFPRFGRYLVGKDPVVSYGYGSKENKRPTADRPKSWTGKSEGPYISLGERLGIDSQKITIDTGPEFVLPRFSQIEERSTFK
ncbi:hypothetical protein GQ43DRAFT_432452 [Delitschia confertaspora ATCC 74209]|uniref:Uncharacterized protein n=1 Tax=Delitschia confertaspora ATCC 74209 TaxID=1513339 RepID=A0A9P4MUV1_9PLEO|nr:hypothetical protein GQ43DRAFT_432452 [Delitschia confertaspora ATCC 74209]